MRLQFLGAFLLISLMPLAIGCQQTNAPITSPLTPASPFSASSQLAPIQRTSAIGPLGGSVRVPPPGTNSYSVPNNYMGGTAPIGSASTVQPANGFANNAPLQSNINQSGWVESGTAQPQSFGNAFGNASPSGGSQTRSLQSLPGGSQTRSLQSLPADGQQLASTTNTLRPQLDGMRVIDLTQAPPPPGYTPQNPASQFQLNQFAGNQTAGFQSQGGFTNTGGFVDRNVASTSFNSPVAAAGNSQGAQIATVPFGTAPQNTASQSNRPSTDPTNSGSSSQSNDLRWRRPTSQF